MIHLHLVVEGKTESTFVNQVLRDYLFKESSEKIFVDARCVQTNKKHSILYKGGGRNYILIENEIKRWIRQENKLDVWFSTMFDLYKLPVNFPSFKSSQQIYNPYQRIELLEEAFYRGIGYEHFIPYIQLHEFEAFLFCDLEKMNEEFYNVKKAIQKILKGLPKGINSPEEINDDPNTAPSKRLIKEIPEYEGAKVSSAPNIIMRIGIDAIRSKCPHFNEWIIKLLNLTREPELL
jgi:hypothetical protein